MKNCEYNQICKFYSNNCDNEEYQESCWIHTTLEGLLNREVFKSRINKRIHREEHGHKHYQN
ncbi:unnamed protein product [marine sediment metagenome]|uniref:Uncharacterized protein n=1 Tax=marine sediment metagenome TaxID=412755 RepID=X1CIT1_9ZZZZ